LRPEVPAEVEAVVGKCLARSPAARYADAGDLLADLERLKRGEPVRAARSRAGRPLRAALWLAALAAVFAAAAWALLALH